MLPRSKRLSVTLFTNVIANGKMVHSTLFTARILKTANPKELGARFSVAVSKKIAKTAVERNNLRRRAYSSLRGIESRVPKGFHIVLLAKQPLLRAKLPAITQDLENLFVKSGLIK